jgi:hypothetical protein
MTDWFFSVSLSKIHQKDPKPERSRNIQFLDLTLVNHSIILNKISRDNSRLYWHRDCDIFPENTQAKAL